MSQQVRFDAGAADGPPDQRLERSVAAQARLHELVPGGAHTYARASDQYPEGLAPVLARGAGAHVWDVDGNEYVEYGMGLRSVTLGHGYRPVVDAVTTAIADGVSFSRPSRWELDAAEAFCAQVPGAEMVKFAKNGSDATTAAVRLARAATGRDLVAVCTDHPFFSTDDWFIGTTAMDAGIPRGITDLTVGFRYGDLAGTAELLAAHRGEVAALVLEAATAHQEPPPGYLEGLRALCDREGVVLVFDEIITGMRWSSGGAQAVYGVTPDLSTWGKAMGNGFAVSALAGRRELMELGGLATDERRVFLLSTTHGAETAGLAAWLAVHREYGALDVPAVLAERGRRLRAGVEQVVGAAGLADHVTVSGHPACLVFGTRDGSGAPSQPFRTLFLAELLRRGVLAQSFVVSAAHTDTDLDRTVDAVAGALPTYAAALDAGSTDKFLVGPPVAPALRERAAPRRLRHRPEPVRHHGGAR
ncbi:glutamate-1-semialdehyde 2,1-aminomutase [Isoptericola halotolerans]|uniref:Glutamate-1-semialdehyde 2,1-aminomutase n=1 Tax=Isoptericola halotolerans TaxID=300560 RepID=A0ABX2A3J1_9MICO|nr:glutamate-1-semialdehyde 2,1-aminomutase [Isoptericola halotolerans]NOV97435.1 glutamate-1-semialdehyde 2,1-aminomutase [Isoptericola halotolerans]